MLTYSHIPTNQSRISHRNPPLPARKRCAVNATRAPRALNADRGANPRPGLSQLYHLLDNRLRVTLLGLQELHQHLQHDDTDQAQSTLTKIDEDLHMLRQRLARELGHGGEEEVMI
ncbi:MAG: hypothetical protein ACK4RK_12230 [Gemmataceae bacterium]